MSQTEDCIGDVKEWLLENKLALNAPKTDFINITSSRRSGSIPEITVDGVKVPSSECVRDLGIWLDRNMSMDIHIGKVCQSAGFALYQIGRLRKFLDKPSSERLVHAFISSRLDGNNGVLFGLPEKTLARLQRIQNAAARIVCRQKKRDHITPTLKSLHWLPVKGRINFKILLICYKALHGLAPQYIKSLLKQGSSVRLTRSSSSERLLPRRSRTKYGDRCFSYAAPTLWNALPSNIKAAKSVIQFKTLLKTHLFRSFYHLEDV